MNIARTNGARQAETPVEQRAKQNNQNVQQIRNEQTKAQETRRGNRTIEADRTETKRVETNQTRNTEVRRGVRNTENRQAQQRQTQRQQNPNVGEQVNIIA